MQEKYYCKHLREEDFSVSVFFKALACSSWNCCYLFFQIASVAQIKSDHFDDCEQDQPGYEQSLVVPRQIVVL